MPLSGFTAAAAAAAAILFFSSYYAYIRCSVRSCVNLYHLSIIAVSSYFLIMTHEHRVGFTYYFPILTYGSNSMGRIS